MVGIWGGMEGGYLVELGTKAWTSQRTEALTETEASLGTAVSTEYFGVAWVLRRRLGTVVSPRY